MVMLDSPSIHFDLPAAQRSTICESRADPLPQLFGAILNPIFEEFLWLGYAIPTLSARTGLSRAVAISLALRLSVHAYQGVAAFVGILPVGVVFTWYFARTGRLWPVIVAHAVMDAVPLGLARRGH